MEYRTGVLVRRLADCKVTTSNIADLPCEQLLLVVDVIRHIFSCSSWRSWSFRYRYINTIIKLDMTPSRLQSVQCGRPIIHDCKTLSIITLHQPGTGRPTWHMLQRTWQRPADTWHMSWMMKLTQIQVKHSRAQWKTVDRNATVLLSNYRTKTEMDVRTKITQSVMVSSGVSVVLPYCCLPGVPRHIARSLTPCHTLHRPAAIILFSLCDKFYGSCFRTLECAY